MLSGMKKEEKVTAKKKWFRRRASFRSFRIYGTSARQLWQRTAVENPVRPSNLLIGTITYAHRIFWRTTIVSLPSISLFYCYIVFAFAWLRLVITQSFVKANTDYSNWIFFSSFTVAHLPDRFINTKNDVRCNYSQRRVSIKIEKSCTR